MGLIKPAWESGNAEKRLEAINKLFEKRKQDELLTIAQSASYTDARVAAILRLPVPTTNDRDEMRAIMALIELAQHDGNANVRRAVIQRLSHSQYFLSDIAQSRFQDTCLSAVALINNEEWLIKIANSSNFEAVSIEAIRKLQDNSSLEKLSLTCKHIGGKLVCVQNINDQNRLIEIIRKSADVEVVAAALNRIEDRSAFARLLDDKIGTSDWHFGVSLCRKIGHHKTAMRLIVEHGFQSDLIALVKETDNHEILMKIVEKGILDIQIMAAEKMRDPSRMIEYFQDDNITVARLTTGRKEERIRYAKLFIKLFKSNPYLAKNCWSKWNSLISEPHSDILDTHTDYGGSSCHVDEAPHTDTGIGLSFPPYPTAEIERLELVELERQEAQEKRAEQKRLQSEEIKQKRALITELINILNRAVKQFSG